MRRYIVWAPGLIEMFTHSRRDAYEARRILRRQGFRGVVVVCVNA